MLFRHTEEAKRKISLASRGNQYAKGYKHTLEARKKISEAAIGNKRSLGRIPWNKGVTYSRFISEQERQTLSERMKGNRYSAGRKVPLEKHPSWKGGKTFHNGYIKTRCEGHPRAKKNGFYVFEHILVMEKKIGRYLVQGEIVHHINGNKTDNRQENLEILNRQEHIHHHQPYSKRWS